MPNEQPTPSVKQKFLAWFSSIKKNLPPAIVAAESNQLFYPATTAVTRLINFPDNVSTWDQFNKAVFFDLQKNVASEAKPNLGLLPKLNSLNKGFMTSVINSGTTRTFRFLTQDSLQKSTESTLAPLTKNYIDQETLKTIAGGLSGATTGALERVLFHPLDTRKINEQMNIKTVSGLYNGLGVGIIRDSLSAGIFFGTYNAAFNALNNLSNPYVSKDTKDTLDKLGGATVAGAVTAIATNPLNVIKTQMQSRAGNSSASILSGLKDNSAKEKFSSVVNGNLLKELSKTASQNANKGIIETGMDIYAKKGFAGLMTGVRANVALAPFRSTIPFFAFLYAKKKWDEYQGLSNERRPGDGDIKSPAPMKA